MTRFYEKVVKVKADVAAILNFFSRSTPQIEADHLDAASPDSAGTAAGGKAHPAAFNCCVGCEIR
jgi:hypothetical protein